MRKIREIKMNTKPKIGFIGVDRLNILKDLNFAADNGFEYYEVASRKIFNLKPEIIKKAKWISERYNISLNFHIPYFLEISSYIPGISEIVLKFAKKEIVLANKCGAKIITIHSGYKEAVLDENFKVLIRNLREIIRLGRKHGVEIGLENSTFKGGGLCANPEEMLKAFNSLKDLKMVFDIGHANTTGLDVIKYFKKVKDHIINIHIHDNNGEEDQHLLIGEGNINFKKFLKECKKSNYYGPFILEVFPYENVLKSREIFLNIWNQI